MIGSRPVERASALAALLGFGALPAARRRASLSATENLTPQSGQ